MKIKKIKNTDLEIAPIVFGGNVFGWTADEKLSHEILDKFVDLGFNAIDTSNQYSHWVPGNKGGESEQIIGNWLEARKNRSDVVIMTKVGGRFAENPNYNTSSKHIIEQVELSLRRLKTDYIDLYQTHYDQESVQVEETLKAYDKLVKEGKVRYIGTSNMSAERIEESIVCAMKKNLPIYHTLQPEYNLYDRAGFEDKYLSVVQKYSLTVIPYYSLASGFLTGKYQKDEDFDQSLRSGGVKERYWNERGKRILGAMKKVSEEYHCSYASIALAWLLNNEWVVAPIASVSKPIQLNGFTEAVQLQLSKESVSKLNEASAY